MNMTNTSGIKCFSTLWWVVVGATWLPGIDMIVATPFQYPLVGRGGSNPLQRPTRPPKCWFQYPLVGRGGSNAKLEHVDEAYLNVSVPSGGSWWEQLSYSHVTLPITKMFQYPLVGRGGSNYGRAPGALRRPGVSVPSGGSWWEQPAVILQFDDAQRVSVPSGGSWWEQPSCRWDEIVGVMFQYPLVGRGGSNDVRTTGLRQGLLFQYPLVGRGGSNTVKLRVQQHVPHVSVPSGGSWWEQPPTIFAPNVGKMVTNLNNGANKGFVAAAFSLFFHLFYRKGGDVRKTKFAAAFR